MKGTWTNSPVTQREIERELPKLQPNFLAFECVFGPHKADLLHRGTAYCRTCYDDRNVHGTLIDQ
jgi:hypothetical protein